MASRHRITLLANVRSDDEIQNIEAIGDLCERIEVEHLPSSAAHRLARMAKGLMSGRGFIECFHFNEKLARRISAITAQEKFDIIQIELSFFARYAKAISPSCKAKKVLSTHNIETQRFRSELRLSSWSFRRLVLLGDSLLFPHWERRAMSEFDGVIAVSEQDVGWIEENPGNRPVQLVPNGVDLEYFQPHRSESDEPPSIVFTGLMDYPPNVDAVCWFVKEIFPSIRSNHPDLSFKIVGARPTDKVQTLGGNEGVEVTGEVPDIRPFVDKAMAFVVPLRSGGGTRLKILQAMAMACPVISTAVGAEGLWVSDGDTILFAENAAQFVSQIDRLMASPQEAGRIGAAGRDLVAAQYDWQDCLAGVEKLYRQLLGDVAR